MDLYKLYNDTKNERWDILKLAINPKCDIKLLDYIMEFIEDFLTKLQFLVLNGATIYEIDRYFKRMNKIYFNFYKYNYIYLYMSYDLLKIDKYQLVNINNILENPNITIDFIKKYKNVPWNWKLISKHPNITTQDYFDNINLKWSYTDMFKNKNLDIDFIKESTNFIKISKHDWNVISENQNISMEDILNNENLDWNYDYVSNNPNINSYYASIFLEKNISLNFYKLSNHISDIKFILKHKNKNWNWNQLSKIVNIKDIDKNINLKWNFSCISENLTVTIDFIRKYFHKNWDFSSLSRNKNIGVKEIENNLDLPWNWYYITKNTNITIPFVVKYRYKFNTIKHWKYISMNVKLDIDEFEENYISNWYWKYLSLNNTITYDFVIKYRNNIYFDELSENEFDINIDTQYYYQIRKNETMNFCKKIKNELLDLTWNPYFFKKLCLSEDELKFFTNNI